MQSLAWSSVFILVLLLPGFFFFVGLVTPERFARDVTPRNPLGALAATVLVSFLSHAILSGLSPRVGVGYPVDWEAVLEAMQLSQPRTGESGNSAARAAQAYSRHPVAIPVYVALSCVIGWLTGLMVGRGVVSGRLRLLVKHSWTYGFMRSRDKLPYASVLTSVENNENVLQYRGRLLYFNLNADGTFAYVVLALIEQRFLKMDGSSTQPEPPGRRNPGGGGESRTPAELSWFGELRMFGRRFTDALADPPETAAAAAAAAAATVGAATAANPAAATAQTAGAPELVEAGTAATVVTPEAPEIPGSATMVESGAGPAVAVAPGVVETADRAEKTRPSRRPRIAVPHRWLGKVERVRKVIREDGEAVLRAPRKRVARLKALPRWCLDALRRALQPDEIESVLVIPGAHVRSVVIDAVYKVQDPTTEEADFSSEAAKILADPTLTDEERLARLERLQRKNAAASPPVAPPAAEAPDQPAASAVPGSVAAMQKILNDLGHNAGPADGIMGELTVAAIKRFQKKHKLKQDGLAGERTIRELQASHEAWMNSWRDKGRPPGTK
jgi:hypothetical protein